MGRVLSRRSAALQHVPKEILFYLTDPPLWPGESRDEYMALLNAVAGACGAGDDVLKWLLADEVTHQLWEMRRLRRIEAGIILKRQAEVIEEVFKTTFDPESEGCSLVFL